VMARSLDAEDLVILDVSFVASIASAVGALLILLNWLCATQRSFVLRLIVFLSFANLVTAVAYMMSFFEWRLTVTPAFDRGWCLAQAMLMIIFEDASILWTGAIAVTMHYQVVARRKNIDRLERWYHLVCWGVPLALAVTLFLTGMLGEADAPRNVWCWIGNGGSNASSGAVAVERGGESLVGHGPQRPVEEGPKHGTRWLQFCVFYLPLALAFAFILVTYVRVGQAFSRMVRDGEIDATKEQKIQLRLRLYLLVFFTVWAPPLVHRFLEALPIDVDPFWLRVLHTATQCSMGSLNCLVYGCNKATLRPTREALRRCSLLSGLQLTSWKSRRPQEATAVFSTSPLGMDRTLLLDSRSLDVAQIGPLEAGASADRRAS